MFVSMAKINNGVGSANELVCNRLNNATNKCGGVVLRKGRQAVRVVIPSICRK